MKAFYKMWFLLITTVTMVYSQDWPLAPEVWSKPVLLDSALNQKWKWYDTPSFTRNFDTIYYTGGNGVYRAVRKIINQNIVWDTLRLNEKINIPGQYAPFSCSISRDGKRLYIAHWTVGKGVDIWKSIWDKDSKDWGVMVNMGDVINTRRGDGYLYEVSEDTVYTISNHIGLATIYYYIFDKQKNEWAIADSFSNVYRHPFRDGDKYGLSLTSNKKKLYLGQHYQRYDTNQPLDQTRKRREELAVSYYDENKKEWGTPYYLNINSQGYYPDSIKWPGSIAGGSDMYPWISEDGKVLIFSSDRDVIVDSLGNGDFNPKLYISYLLKDENGEPVGVETDENNNPIDYYLFPNYPNPFNSSTIISYNLPKSEHVTIIIFDLLGKEIAKLIDKEMNAGMHTIVFAPQLYNLASGVYIYRLKTPTQQISKQMVYLK